MAKGKFPLHLLGKFPIYFHFPMTLYGFHHKSCNLRHCLSQNLRRLSYRLDTEEIRSTTMQVLTLVLIVTLSCSRQWVQFGH